MTDIVDLFLDRDNVEKMNRIFARNNCDMRKYMYDFIYGPYAGGMYDILTGTDVDLYLRHMNNEFIKFMKIRKNVSRNFATRNETSQGEVSASIETASYLNPFDHTRERARRAELNNPRRPIIRGTGASMGGAKNAFANRSNFNGSSNSTKLTDELYSRWNRDQVGTVHMTTRDDEASDAGYLDYTQRFAHVPCHAADPFDFKESYADSLRDPTAGSGETQHHLLVLDSQLSVLNHERTIPLGYGSAEDQLADDARIAARYSYRDQFGADVFGDSAGVIPKTNYKKLKHVITPSGRVTLDDERELASDIMSCDSKGFILSGRR